MNSTKRSSLGIAAIIFFTYAEKVCYQMSWGPLPWLYLDELFSSRTRDFGVATGAASQLLFNLVMPQIAHDAISNMKCRIFLMFAIFNYAIVGYSWLFSER